MKTFDNKIETGIRWWLVPLGIKVTGLSSNIRISYVVVIEL